jgi:squalene cyclase
LALEALGINPYSGSPLDTISPIVTAYDGTQIGSASLDNDDIFALLALQYAGYTQQDDIIRKTAVFVISKQKADGSWDASADMTAAAIQALGALYTVPGYGPALGKAQGYLAAHQQTTGGWDNADSTS